ncbi:DUF1127 domain-containing protein [Agrobacterium salinitolerans]|nr:DUF1127 domain-containing protein [Agrobacterium salinitolerans]
MTAVANDNVCRTQGNAISRFVRKFIEARRARQGMRDMLALGDHLLRDIGVSRFDIHTAMRAPVNSCAARLAALAEENRRSQVRIETEARGIRPQTVNEQVKLAA